MLHLDLSPCSLHHESIHESFKQWFIDCGGSPGCLYKDFDPKILDPLIGSFLCDKNIVLRGALSGHQNQNIRVQ